MYVFLYDDSTLASGRGRYVDIVAVVAYVVGCGEALLMSVCNWRMTVSPMISQGFNNSDFELWTLSLELKADRQKR